ncbi:ubiquinol-cytochrome c reductase iron-sulfur subunit [Bacteroidota bacterium]
MNRREMLLKSSLLAGGFCTCSNIFGKDDPRSNCCFTPEIEPECLAFRDGKAIIDLDRTHTINEPGYAAFIIDEEKGIDIILVHADEGEFYALQRLCTHGGRSISYIHERGKLQCNNYNHSTFDLSGEVFKGPAPRSLVSYPVELNMNQLEISVS